MCYDAFASAARGLLLADHLKSIITGVNLPPDLDAVLEGGVVPDSTNLRHQASD